MEMIPEQFRTIDPLTSFGLEEAILHAYHRHNAFRALAATSRRLRTMFRDRSWETRALVGTEIPTLVRFLGQPETPRILAPHVGCVTSFTCAVVIYSPFMTRKSNPDLASHLSQEISREAPERSWLSAMFQGMLRSPPSPTHVGDCGQQIDY